MPMFDFRNDGTKLQRTFPSEVFRRRLSVQPKDVVDVKTSIEQDPQMADIEKRLNNAKNQLDVIFDTDNATYSRISDAIEAYKGLRRKVQEMGIPNVTNAWLKMYEMLKVFPLVDPTKKVIHFDNAALPGAFIEATNNYMATNHPNVEYDWSASSLIPVGEDTDTLDDQYGLWAANRDRWLMRANDPNRTGDITDVKYLQFLRDHFKHTVTLYTSDAGISVAPKDFTDLAFNDQEQLNMLINLGQVLSGLIVLAPGGTFVTKQYTFFKPFTYTLMVIAASCFDKFYVAKPLTSKASNSEVYLIGIGFKGYNEIKPMVDHLENTLANTKNVVPLPPALLGNVPTSTMDEILAAARIYNQQIEMIMSNIDFYRAFRGDVRRLEGQAMPMHKEMETLWLKKYNPRPVPAARQLASRGQKQNERHKKYRRGRGGADDDGRVFVETDPMDDFDDYDHGADTSVVY